MRLNPDDPVDAIALAWRSERPRTPVGSIGIVTRILRIAKLLSDDRGRLLRGAGADDATLDLLATLRRSGAPYRMSTRDLAAATLVTAGAITQRVDRAQRQGLVVRSPRPDGSRRVDVELTTAGHELVEHLVDTVLGREDELLTCLDPGERETLTLLLRTLHDGLPGSTAAPPPDAEPGTTPG